jgi:hypothetical protein
LPGNLYLTEMLEAPINDLGRRSRWSEGFNDEYRAPDTPAPPRRRYVDQQDNM